MIISIISIDQVHDLKTFEAYIHQRLGTPFTTVDDRKRLGKWTKEFLEKHPRASWRTLCRIVDWAKDHNRRPARSFQVQFFAEDAWKARYIPELDPNPERDLMDRAEEILKVETDPQWRERLLYSAGSLLAQTISEWDIQHNKSAPKPRRRTRQPKQLSLDDTAQKEQSNERGARAREVTDVAPGRPSDREG